jgi:predicted  nucleic acid-binding Zn-ribbon protein
MTASKEKTPNEPTIADVIELIRGSDGKINNLNGRFDSLETRMNSFESSMREGFAKVHERIDKVELVGRTLLKQQDLLSVRVDAISQQTTNLVYQVATIQETLTDLTEAETKDALATINHEKRIIRLENLSKIKPSTLKHLKKT